MSIDFSLTKADIVDAVIEQWLMKAFVTGGSGFVGRSLIGLLQERGYEVRALARSDRAAQQVAELGAEVVRGDLLDEQAMRQGMQGCEVVFHVAGYLSSWGTYEAFYEANVVGTERALSAAKAASVSRFVQVGASAVVMDDQPVLDADETLPLQPSSFSPYIATKSIAEQRVIAANEPGFTTSVVRPSWIWGKGDLTLRRMWQTSVMVLFLRLSAALEDKPTSLGMIALSSFEIG
jgi:nucleoside-diphosphate-sugar epimerase